MRAAGANETAQASGHVAPLFKSAHSSEGCSCIQSVFVQQVPPPLPGGPSVPGPLLVMSQADPSQAP